MKEKILQIINKLGFSKKIKENQMTDSDWSMVSKSFMETYNIDIEKAIEQAQKTPVLEKKVQDAIAEMIGTNIENESTDLVDMVKDLKMKVNKLESDNQILGAQPEPDQITKIIHRSNDGLAKGKVKWNSRAHTKSHVFGIENEIYSTQYRWNKAAVTGEINPLSYTDSEEKTIKKSFVDFTASLRSRWNHLQKTGQFGILMTDSVDYSDLELEWGAQYVVRRQDAIIKYLRALPSVSSIFPVRYGVQHREELTSAFPVGGFSQAYQPGRVFSGAIKFAPELAQVDDVMFKFKFDDLKKLEKEHIGYLNREDSSPYKWSFVEWLCMMMLEKLANERELRRIWGARLEPTLGETGNFLNAADGVLMRIDSYEEDYKILPFEDLGLYTSATMVDYIESLVEKMNQLLPTLNGIQIGVNEKHMAWYKQSFREKYGTQTDFSGAGRAVIDYSVKELVGIPNMEDSQKIIVWIPGEIELLEMAAGEMANFRFQTDLEEIIAFTMWKEGVGCPRPGYKFSAKQTEIDPNLQYIFTNYPIYSLAADATTADATKYHIFKTVSNSAAKAITDITGAKDGKFYKIICGGTTNATTIAKSGKFSVLSAAWIPTALSDYIIVVYNKEKDKFYEIRRRVTA